jgi:hypothetical protein
MSLLSLVAALCIGAASPSLARITQDAYLTTRGIGPVVGDQYGQPDARQHHPHPRRLHRG